MPAAAAFAPSSAAGLSFIKDVACSSVATSHAICQGGTASACTHLYCSRRRTHRTACTHRTFFVPCAVPQYRTTRNYKDGAFLGPRIGDKILISLLIMTLYLGIGDDASSDNFINISAVLFMWCVMPAFGAAAYVPALVLERNLFVRERADGMYHVITYLLAKMVGAVRTCAWDRELCKVVELL